LSIPVGPLQVGVEVLAGLQGSSQHCCLWVDPCVLLRPAQEYGLRLTERGLAAARKMLDERRLEGAWKG